MIMPPLRGWMLTCCQPQSHGNKQAAREAPPGASRQSRRHRRESTQRLRLIDFSLSKISESSVDGGGGVDGTTTPPPQGNCCGFFSFGISRDGLLEKRSVKCPSPYFCAIHFKDLKNGTCRRLRSYSRRTRAAALTITEKKKKKRKQNHRQREITYAFRENYHLEVEKVFTKDCCCSSVMAKEPLWQKTAIFTQAPLLAAIVSESLQIQMK